MTITLLTCPGIGNSGPSHWQTLWEQGRSNVQRISQRDWDHPVCDEWVAALEETVRQIDAPVMIVAHSMACLMVAHWAVQTQLKIKGALLVAPPDPKGPAFPKEAQGFASLPLQRLPFSSSVVASTNDPYATIDFAQDCATAWGSHFVNVGDAGHINASSNLGHWHEGLALLERLMA